jgi:hypothetical protein
MAQPGRPGTLALSVCGRQMTDNLQDMAFCKIDVPFCNLNATKYLFCVVRLFHCLHPAIITGRTKQDSYAVVDRAGVLTGEVISPALISCELLLSVACCHGKGFAFRSKRL